jgi:rubrerythrin
MENNKTLEILKTAILLEKRGNSFYTQVAEQTKSPDVKQIFESLAQEEIAHIKFLSDQYSSYKNSSRFADFKLTKEDEEAIAKQVLNRDIKKQITAASYEAAAISAAIDMENRAIKVYSERAIEATDPNEKALFQMLADWEKTHHTILFELDKQLKEDIWFDNNFWPY